MRWQMGGAEKQATDAAKGIFLGKFFTDFENPEPQPWVGDCNLLERVYRMVK
jgi:hypothetical protein